MDIDLTTYREQAGFTRFARLVPRTYFYNQDFRRFMAKYIPAVQKGVKIRSAYKAEGIGIPSFITSSISEHYTGYNTGEGLHVCPSKPEGRMNIRQWRMIFEQAAKLGIHMIVLMCGSSTACRDVLAEAALFPQIIFTTVIDSGLMSEEYIALFEKNRNIMPVLTISYDAYKGEESSAEQLKKAEEKLKSKKISFGAYVTVTSKNLKAVTDQAYVSELKNRGYTSISYMEHIQAEAEAEVKAEAKGKKGDLPLSKSERRNLRAVIDEMSEKLQNELVIFLFAIDRNNSDNRDYIHINPDGSVESIYDLKNLNLKSDTMLSAFEAISTKK